MTRTDYKVATFHRYNRNLAANDKV